MALKALMLRKRIDIKKKELDKLRSDQKDMEKREAELVIAIEEAGTEEEQAAVQESVDALIEEKEKLEESVAELDKVIKDLESELAAEESKQEIQPAAEPAAVEPVNEERSNRMNKTATRDGAAYTRRDRLAQLVTRDDVKSFLSEVRSAIKEKRALTNVGLLIPEIVLPLLRENIADWSKLYRHVSVRPIGGQGRMPIMGSIPEAIWTDCCANLNELSLAFNDFVVDCWKVGGYYEICNANLEDSDIDLAAEIITALGQAIGKALDKAILFGRNTDAVTAMPLGVVSRLLQESQPAGYPATARPWVDLHTSNVFSIAQNTTGASLISAIVYDSGAMKGKYSRGEKVWIMNEKTYTTLMANTVSVDASGRIVSGVSDVMPVVGGIIEVLELVPDNMIVGGYFDLYLLAERAGRAFASSEHVKFLADETVFKGTARYDGGPAIAEAFVCIMLNGGTASTAAAGVAFAPDEANAVQFLQLNTSTASVRVGETVQLLALTSPGTGAITWSSATPAKATVSDNGVVTGVATGSSVITATANGLTQSCTVTVTAS